MANIYPSLEDFKYDILMNSKHLTSNIGTHLRGVNGQAINRGGGGNNIYATNNCLPIANGTSKYAPTAAAAIAVDLSNQHQHQQLYPSFDNYNNYSIGRHLLSDEMQSQSGAIYPSLSKTIMVAPLSGYSQAQKMHPSNAIRQVIICKDTNGKVGLRVGAIQGGIFVVLVHASSPAAMAGLKFGDQILEINDLPVAGFSMAKVHDLIKKSSPDEIRFAIRDRPFARSVTLHKDQNGMVGFIFNKNGKIVSINRDSSAARNGLLSDHNMIEINAQNIVGLDDTEIRLILDNCGDVVVLTVLPSKIFEQMIEHTDPKLIRKSMDHSAPE